MKKINTKTQGKFVFTVNVVVNVWFSRLSIKTLVLYIRLQRILYQRILYHNQKMWANYIFCGKLTIYYFHISEKYGNAQ